MQQLKREERIAIARILIDLIEADFVIEVGEMEFFERAISKECFNITEKMLVEAKKIDLARALVMLKELDIERRQVLVQTLKQLSLSDGECVPSEATLIYAIEQVLLGNATIYSIPKLNIEIANLKAIYVENESVVAKYDNEIAKMKRAMTKQSNEIEKLSCDLRTIENSTAFKLGRKITFVPHLVKNRLKKQF